MKIFLLVVIIFFLSACSSQSISTNDYNTENNTQNLNSEENIVQINKELQIQYEELLQKYKGLEKKLNEYTELSNQINIFSNQKANYELKINELEEEITTLKISANLIEKEEKDLKYYLLKDRISILEQKILEIFNNRELFDTTLENLTELMNMSKAEVICNLGYDYINTADGVDDTNYYYWKYGMEIKFENNTAGISLIKCNENAEINGIKTDMTFKQIQDILGPTEIIESKNNKNSPMYYIMYTMDNYEIYCGASERDGKVYRFEIRSVLSYNPILVHGKLIGAVRKNKFFDLTTDGALQLTYLYKDGDVVDFCMTKGTKLYKLYNENEYVENTQSINTYMRSGHIPHLYVDLETELDDYDWDYAFGFEWEPVPRDIKNINPNDTHKKWLEEILEENNLKNLPTNINTVKLVDIDNDGQEEEFIEALYINEGEYSYSFIFMVKRNSEKYMLLNEFDNSYYTVRGSDIQFYDIDGNGTMEVMLHYYYAEDSYIKTYTFKNDRFIEVLSYWEGV